MLRPQQQAHVDARVLRGVELPPAPAAPGRLLAGDHDTALRRAEGRPVPHPCIGGIHRGQNGQLKLRSVLPKKAPHALLGEDVRTFTEAIAPVGRRLDGIALLPERVHRLPDRRSRHAERLRDFLAGQEAALPGLKQLKQPFLRSHAAPSSPFCQSAADAVPIRSAPYCSRIAAASRLEMIRASAIFSRSGMMNGKTHQPSAVIRPISPAFFA